MYKYVICAKRSKYVKYVKNMGLKYPTCHQMWSYEVWLHHDKAQKICMYIL